MDLKTLQTNVLSKSEAKGARNGFLTFVAQNYSSMSKEELACIIKELDYAIYKRLDEQEYNGIIWDAVELIDEAEVFETVETDEVDEQD